LVKINVISVMQAAFSQKLAKILAFAAQWALILTQKAPLPALVARRSSRAAVRNYKVHHRLMIAFVWSVPMMVC
jgi:hypothetical protein